MERKAAANWAAAIEAAAIEAKANAAIEMVSAELFAAGIEAVIHQVAVECVVIGVAVEDMVVELEKADAQRQQLKMRLAREMAPDRGFIDEARAWPSARNENACFICIDPDVPTDSYMPCCRHHVHCACIKRWHAMGRNMNKHQVKAPNQNYGWIPVNLARLRQCPYCSADMLSARVPKL